MFASFLNFAPEATAYANPALAVSIRIQHENSTEIANVMHKEVLKTRVKIKLITQLH